MTKLFHVLLRMQTEEMQNEPRYEGIFYLQSCLHQPALNSNSIESETAPQGCLQHHTASQTVLQAKVFKTQQTNAKFTAYTVHPSSAFELA